MAFSMEEFTRELAERLDAWEENNREVVQLSRRIESGEATYADVERLASLTGRSTGKVLADALVQNAVNGKVTEDVARAILSKPLEDNYNRIAEACRLAQEALNRKAGLGLNAVKPNLPRGRINGIITETAGKEDVNSFAGTLVQQVENLSLSTVDDSVRENAAAHSRAGLRPKIRRIADSDCCDWCSTLEGTYDYTEVSDTGNDVFRRHANCRCQVIYDPADGKRWQDAHSKRLLSADESAKIEARKTYGLDEEQKTPEQRVAEAERRQTSLREEKKMSVPSSRDIENKPNPGERISSEELEKFAKEVENRGYRFSPKIRGLSKPTHGGFEEFRGSINDLYSILDELDKSKLIWPEKLKRKGILLAYEDFGNLDDFAGSIGRTIKFNKRLYDDQDFLMSTYDKAVNEGVFVAGTTYKSIPWHELGHVLSKIDPSYQSSLITVIRRMDGAFLENALSLTSKYGIKMVGGEFDELLSEMLSASTSLNKEKHDRARKVLEVIGL